MNIPNTPPPLFRDQRPVDAGHLKALVICHYVGAGLSLLGLGFIGLHYTLMSALFDNPHMWQNAQGGPDPEQFFAVFKWFYLIGVIACLAYGVANLLSARFIQTRKHRVFSMVVAGFNCLHMPLGTLLGVFTFIVLSRDTVQVEYES